MGLMSLHIVNALADLPSTDVFIMSHGWRADVASAKRQYAAWIDAMLACTDDLAHANDTTGFSPTPRRTALAQ